MKKNLGLTNIPIYSPVTNNHLFNPALSDRVSSNWKRRGFNYISEFFAFSSQLQTKFQFPQSKLSSNQTFSSQLGFDVLNRTL